MTLRLAVLSATLLSAGAVRAATAVPSQVERAYEDATPSAPTLDYTSCPTPQAQAAAQLDAVLRHADTERGAVVAKGGCAVTSPEQAPTQLDQRRRR
jgi:hypothetical protein